MTLYEGRDREAWPLVPSISLFHQLRVGIDDKGVLFVLPEAKIPLMIASDLDLNVAEKTATIGTLSEDQPAQ